MLTKASTKTQKKMSNHTCQYQQWQTALRYNFLKLVSSALLREAEQKSTEAQLSVSHGHASFSSNTRKNFFIHKHISHIWKHIQ